MTLPDALREDPGLINLADRMKLGIAAPDMLVAANRLPLHDRTGFRRRFGGIRDRAGGWRRPAAPRVRAGSLQPGAR
jgi:hypothetical protein